MLADEPRICIHCGRPIRRVVILFHNFWTTSDDDEDLDEIFCPDWTPGRLRPEVDDRYRDEHFPGVLIAEEADA